MTKKAFDSIMAGLRGALAYTKGDKTRGRATTRVQLTTAAKKPSVALEEYRAGKRSYDRKTARRRRG
jgi:hypothetical protein